MIIISFIDPSAKERVFDKTLSQMNLLKETNVAGKNQENEIYIFSKEHHQIYISAYKMLLDNKILGVGVKNFRIFCNDKKYEESWLSCAPHPHNTYIQILSETGIIGFLFLITIFFYYCGYTLKHIILRFKGKHYFNDFEICILSAIAIYIWPFVPTGNIFNNWLNIIMILNLPLLIWGKKIEKL